MITQEQQWLGYKISHHLLPGPIHHLFDKRGRKKQHRYPARNKAVPNIQQHHHKLYNSSFLCRNIVSYTKLPGTTRNSTSLECFSKKLRLKYNY